MFLLVSVRHYGAHPDEHQHGVSIQISINLGKTFLRISRIRNIPLTWILARIFAYLPSFISQILDLLNGFDFYFDLFWRAWHWKPVIRVSFRGQRLNDSEYMFVEIEFKMFALSLWTTVSKSCIAPCCFKSGCL